MALDVNDLNGFYASSLGEVSRRLIGRVLRARWDNCAGLSILGLGFCGPYLDRFRDEAARVLAFMPAAQGVIHWPASGRSASALDAERRYCGRSSAVKASSGTSMPTFSLSDFRASTSTPACS